MMNAENEGAAIDFPSEPALNQNAIHEDGKIHISLGSKTSAGSQFAKCIEGFLIPADTSTGNNQNMLPRAPLVIETLGFLPNARGLRSIQMLLSLKKRKSDKEISQATQLSSLSPYVKKHIRNSALSIRRRLSVAQMIFHNHSLFILQDPFLGLDKQEVSCQQAYRDCAIGI